ncbi:MAG TPA: hypothetical protein VFC75_03710 [Erysipelothrix sp.]|nr:hypothetical protein [Erysipelothrix sp.]
MKKILIVFLTAILLTSCSTIEQKLEKESYALYETYWRLLLNETQFQTSSRNFNIEAEIIKSDNTYEYIVTVDKAKVAMYDVEIVVIENKKSIDAVDEMLPSAGIFEKKFNMIPNQARNEESYMAGANLTRQDFSEDEVTLQVLVAWENYSRMESFREVFEFDLKYEEKKESEEKKDKENDDKDKQDDNDDKDNQEEKDD